MKTLTKSTGNPYRRKYRIKFNGDTYVVRVRYRYWPFWIKAGTESKMWDTHEEAEKTARTHAEYPKAVVFSSSLLSDA